jgi:hypothetical protein
MYIENTEGEVYGTCSQEISLKAQETLDANMKAIQYSSRLEKICYKVYALAKETNKQLTGITTNIAIKSEYNGENLLENQALKNLFNVDDNEKVCLPPAIHKRYPNLLLVAETEHNGVTGKVERQLCQENDRFDMHISTRKAEPGSSITALVTNKQDDLCISYSVGMIEDHEFKPWDTDEITLCNNEEKRKIQITVPDDIEATKYIKFAINGIAKDYSIPYE